jgi:hypothetical protein
MSRPQRLLAKWKLHAYRKDTLRRRLPEISDLIAGKLRRSGGSASVLTETASLFNWLWHTECGLMDTANDLRND